MKKLAVHANLETELSPLKFKQQFSKLELEKFSLAGNSNKLNLDHVYDGSVKFWKFCC